MISRYKKKLPKGGFLRSMGGLTVVDRVFVGADSAQQMPNKVLRSNACNAAPQKVLAKCEKPLCLRHFGEHWRILCPWSLTENGGMFPVV
jgi:hypothetical protein